MSLFLFFTRLDKLFQVLRSKGLFLSLLRYQVLVGAEHRHVLCRDLATVVDIGANRGQFSLAIRAYAPKAHVIAFEPLPGPGEIFRRVFAGDPMVCLHPVAIGANAGEAVIHVTEADDSSSLLPVSPLQEKLFRGCRTVATETIKVGRLADFVSAQKIVSSAMLKLDVQGYELEALRGCDDLLDRFMYVYAECSFVELYSGQALAHEVIAWLRERSFKLSGVYNVCYDKDGRVIQGDFLFRADQRAKSAGS